MDAIIIADTSSESVSATNKLKLTVDGHIASIQNVTNFVQNNGRLVLPVPGEGVSSWASSMKLNGIFLYSYLSGKGFDLGLIDSYFEQRERFVEMLKESPRTVIISTTFIMSKKALHQLVRDIRTLAPDIFIVAGGQFVHLSNRIRERLKSDNPLMDIYSSDYLFLDEEDEPEVDLYIISSRGEAILASALSIIKTHGKCESLPNTATYLNKMYNFGNQTDDIIEKGAVTVDWQRVPADVFKSGVIPMQASYGCPYRCSFCNFMKDRRLMGVKPVETLIEELQTVEEKGVRYVWFADDNFRLGRNDLADVCKRFVEHGISTKWKSFIRASALKTLDMDLLKAAGCIELQFGLESADPAILEAMNKEANPELYSEVIERAMRAGINCSGYFIFGFPGETATSVIRTCEFIKSLEHPALDGYISFSLFPFIIAPLSPISEVNNARKYGLEGYMSKWKHNTMNSKEAREHAMQVFGSIEYSGLIFNADNLDMLMRLTPPDRKAFIAARHRLTKLSVRENLSEEYKFREFAKVLRDPVRTE